MKNYFVLLSMIFFVHSVWAKEPLRTLDSIEFENGDIQKAGLIADTDGIVFLEFNENVLSVITDGKTKFTGEIMPPEIIVLPTRAPRARMREIFTFELLADTSEDISFSDKIDLLNERNRIRLSYNSPDDLVRTAAVKLLAPIKEEFGALALWKYSFEEKEWQRLGGKTNETSEEDTFVFSAIIWGTGVYALLDENPSPTFSPTFPIDEIEIVDESPFPSVETENLNNDILNDYQEEPLFANESPSMNDLFEESSVYTTDEVYEVPALRPLNETSSFPNENTSNLETDNKNPNVEYLSAATIQPEEFLSPINSTLPKSGSEGSQRKSSSTPIIIFITMTIVGTSFYFSVKKNI